MYREREGGREECQCGCFGCVHDTLLLLTCAVGALRGRDASTNGLIASGRAIGFGSRQGVARGVESAKATIRSIPVGK